MRIHLMHTHTPIKQHGHFSQVRPDSGSEGLSSLHQGESDEACSDVPIPRGTNSVRVPIHFVNSDFIPVISYSAN